MVSHLTHFAAYRSLIDVQSKEIELNYNTCTNTTLKRFLVICHVERYLAFSVPQISLSQKKKLLFFGPDMLQLVSPESVR